MVDRGIDHLLLKREDGENVAEGSLRVGDQAKEILGQGS